MRVYQRADGTVKTATIHQSDKIPMLIFGLNPSAANTGKQPEETLC